ARGRQRTPELQASKKNYPPNQQKKAIPVKQITPLEQPRKTKVIHRPKILTWNLSQLTWNLS
ncbi:hypothetical protein, partial [Thiolapillus sp.]|uniref:hypothetical protein n=1 Tax=Thiolapillus sp. TaxID=2017437 RepID=UPI003AF49D04